MHNKLLVALMILQCIALAYVVNIKFWPSPIVTGNLHSCQVLKSNNE
jgi:hypothetical protein